MSTSSPAPNPFDPEDNSTPIRPTPVPVGPHAALRRQIEDLTAVVKEQDKTIKENNVLLQRLTSPENASRQRGRETEKVSIPKGCSVSTFVFDMSKYTCACT